MPDLSSRPDISLPIVPDQPLRVPSLCRVCAGFFCRFPQQTANVPDVPGFWKGSIRGTPIPPALSPAWRFWRDLTLSLPKPVTVTSPVTSNTSFDQCLQATCHPVTPFTLWVPPRPRPTFDLRLPGWNPAAPGVDVSNHPNQFEVNRSR